MIKFILIIIGIMVIIAIIDYFKVFFITLAVLTALGFIAYKIYKKKKIASLPEPTAESPITEPALAPEPARVPDPEPISAAKPISEPESVVNSYEVTGVTTILPEPVTSQKNEWESARAAKIEQFETELQAIPKVDISLSDPVSRHLMKELPPYSFSNITRKTRLDSIFPLVFLDVETTGFAPSKCEIVEVSAIKFDTGMTPVAAFTTLCKPKKAISEEASAVNHITDDMVANAPAFAQVAPALTEFIKGCHIAGHNLDFDLRFIFAHGADLPEKVRFYDTLDIAHLTIPNSSVYNYKLDTVCHYYGIWRNNAHRSLSDCYATAKLFTHLVQDKTSRQLDVNEEILSEMTAE